MEAVGIAVSVVKYGLNRLPVGLIRLGRIIAPKLAILYIWHDGKCKVLGYLNMRERFKSLSRERKTRAKRKRWWENVTLPVLISLSSLMISLSSTILSYWSYTLSEDSRRQPYRSAIYSIKLESYQRFGSMVEQWIKLVSEESEIDAALLKLQQGNTFSKRDLIALSNRNEKLSNLSLTFYKSQVIERLYWPNVRSDFDVFDKYIDRMSRCAAIREGMFSSLLTGRVDLKDVKIATTYFESKCRFTHLAKNGEMKPYANVLRALNRDLGLENIGLDSILDKK